MFHAFDASSVLYGNDSGQVKWCAQTNSLDYELMSDDFENHCAIVTGTKYVLQRTQTVTAIDGFTWSVWDGGLTGRLLKGGIKTLDQAMQHVRSLIPPHKIRKAQQQCPDYISGQRERI